MGLSLPPRNVHTSLAWGQAFKPTFEIFLAHFLKKLVGKTSNFTDHPPTLHQSEACNLEMAQHIDKQKMYPSSTTNALKTVPHMGGKIDPMNDMRKRHTLSNSPKIFAG